MTLEACPSDETLVRWASGACAADEAASLAEHIDGCASCRVAFSSALAALRLEDTAPRASLLAEGMPVQVGEVLLRKYEVLEVLGRGGMGVVLRARHLQLNQDVALKFIRPEHLHRPDARARFSREARAAAALRSPFVNRVLDLGELDDGTPFMVLELLTGQPLDARLATEGPAKEADVVRWMMEACLGLEAAHAAGIVHRDLKPANLFLRADGTIAILDFGVARSENPIIEAGLKQTTTPGLVGSPAFMAPEQVSGTLAVGPLVDLWALGCTMQCLLTGEPPFRANDVIDLAWRVRNAAPTPLPKTVSPSLAAIIARCLEKSPDARFQTATALREALARCATPAPVVPTARPGRWPLMVAGAAAVAALAAWALWLNHGPPDLAPTPTAERAARTAPSVAARPETPEVINSKARADDEPRPSRPTERDLRPAPEAPMTPPLVAEPALDAGRLPAVTQRPKSAAPALTRDAGAEDDVYGQRL